MCVFVSVNITSLFTVHWTLSARPGQTKPGGIVPLLEAKNNILTSRGQRSVQAAALGSYRTLRTLKEPS